MKDGAPQAARQPPRQSSGCSRPRHRLPSGGCTILPQPGRGPKGPPESGREGAEKGHSWVKAYWQNFPQKAICQNSQPSISPKRKFSRI